jgi:hypothetical protein
MDIHIDLQLFKLFVAIVIAGVLYGHYVYRQGLKRGWDDLAYLLTDEGLIQIDENGEILRVSDREYVKFKSQNEF